MAQEATSPAKARHYGPSFQQLLLLAFLLIAGLLGTSALRTLFTLEALMTESQASAAQAAALNVAAQTLNQRGQALERAARQSLVLGDAQLRQGFDDMAADARRLVQQLEDAGLPPEQARQWRSHMDTVHELLRAPPGLSLEHERSVADEFVALDNLHAAISQAVQELNARKSSELDAMVQASREAVTHQLLGAIVLALVLARRMAHSPLPERILPAWFITLAPPAVIGSVLAQWQAAPALVLAMWGVSMFFLLWLLPIAKRIASQPFGVSYWALSFPLAALATLTLRVGDLFPDAAGLQSAGVLLLAVTSMVILWLGFATVRGLRDGSLLAPEPLANIQPVPA